MTHDKMTRREAIRVLKDFVNKERWKWGHSWGLVNALDYAIAVLEREGEANKTMGKKGELQTWANLLKHPEMLKCTDPDCMVERSWTIQGQTVTSKYISPEKYMQKYHPADTGNPIDHIADASKKVQNTDSVEGITEFALRFENYQRDAEALMFDMQAHIRKLELDNNDLRHMVLNYEDFIRRKNDLLLEAAETLDDISSLHTGENGHPLVSRIREEAKQ